MKLTDEQVLGVARLARLGVSDEELGDHAAKLSGILDLVEQLQAVDTDGVTPMAHPLDLAQRLRPDEVTETDQRDLYQENSAVTERGLYLVPRVIE